MLWTNESFVVCISERKVIILMFALGCCVKVKRNMLGESKQVFVYLSTTARIFSPPVVDGCIAKRPHLPAEKTSRLGKVWIWGKRDNREIRETNLHI